MTTREQQREALDQFLAVFNGMTLVDIGPHLTCTEAEAFAELLEAHNRHDSAKSLRAGHAETDEVGDLHYEGDES